MSSTCRLKIAAQATNTRRRKGDRTPAVTQCGTVNVRENLHQEIRTAAIGFLLSRNSILRVQSLCGL